MDASSLSPSLGWKTGSRPHAPHEAGTAKTESLHKSPKQTRQTHPNASEEEWTVSTHSTCFPALAWKARSRRQKMHDNLQLTDQTLRGNLPLTDSVRGKWFLTFDFALEIAVSARNQQIHHSLRTNALRLDHTRLANLRKPSQNEKHIQAQGTGIFRHIRAYSGIFELSGHMLPAFSCGKTTPGRAYSLHAPILIIKLLKEAPTGTPDEV